MTPRQSYEQAIAPAVRDPESVRASLDLAERIARHFAVLIERHLQDYRSPRVPALLTGLYESLSPRMLLYGLFTHCICFGSDYRENFHRLDPEGLYVRWRWTSARALSTLDAYSRHNQGFPDAVFKRFYGIEAESAVRASGAWLWKRLTIQSAIRDRFATGVVLGMVIDRITAADMRAHSPTS